MYATFQVPIGYRATYVQVNAQNSASTFDVYECDVANATTTALTSSPAVNTNQLLSSAQQGSAGKYLTIKYTPGNRRRKLYGARIILSRVKMEEQTFNISLKNLVTIGGIIALLVGEYIVLQKDIEEAKKLPIPIQPEVTRVEFDMQNDLILQTIATTKQDLLEIKEDLKDIKKKLYK